MEPASLFKYFASGILTASALVVFVMFLGGTDVAMAQTGASAQIQEFVNHVDDIACQGEQVRDGILPPQSYRVSSYDFSDLTELKVLGDREVVASNPSFDNGEVSVDSNCGEVVLCDPGIPIENCNQDNGIVYNDPGQLSFQFRYDPHGAGGEGSVKLQRQADIDEEGPFLVYVNDTYSSQQSGLRAVSVTSGQTFNFYDIGNPSEPDKWYRGDIIGKTGDMGQDHKNSVMLGNETELYRVDLATINADSVAFQIKDRSNYNIQDIGGIGDIMDDTNDEDVILIEEDGAPDEYQQIWNICAANVDQGTSQCTNVTEELGLRDYSQEVKVGGVVDAGYGKEATMIDENEPYLYLWDGEDFRNKTITKFRACEEQNIYDTENWDDANLDIIDVGGTINADFARGYDDQDLVAIMEYEGNDQLGYIKLQGPCAYTAEIIEDAETGADVVGYPKEDRIPYLMASWGGDVYTYNILREENIQVTDTEDNAIQADDISTVIPSLVP